MSLSNFGIDNHKNHVLSCIMGRLFNINRVQGESMKNYIKTPMRKSLIDILLLQTHEIMINPQLDGAIVKHFNLLLELYIEKPLYFKILFKANRFILGLVILSKFYATSDHSLKGLKEHCLSLNILSKNTIDSFIFYLRAGRRLNMLHDVNNKRKLTYEPTEKALEETRRLLNSMVIPYDIMFPERPLGERVNAIGCLSMFFNNYSELVFNEIFVVDFVVDAQPLVTKDAGHMILYHLFSEVKRQNSTIIKINYYKSAIICGISRSHLKRCLLSCEKEKLISINKNANYLQISTRLTMAARYYFSLYLATIVYGFKD